MKYGTLAFTLFASGAIAGIGAYNVTKWIISTDWRPTSETAPIVFLLQGDKPIPAIQLSNTGALTLDIPAIYKQWQLQEESKKAEDKKKAATK